MDNKFRRERGWCCARMHTLPFSSRNAPTPTFTFSGDVSCTGCNGQEHQGNHTSGPITAGAPCCKRQSGLRSGPQAQEGLS